MTLGDKLRKARQGMKLTQEDVAKKIGVDYSTVSKWESNSSSPSIEKLRALALMLEISMVYLIDEDADRIPTTDTKLAESYIEYGYLRDIESMSLEDIIERYNIKIEGQDATKEEIQDAIAYIKARRIMKSME